MMQRASPVIDNVRFHSRVAKIATYGCETNFTRESVIWRDDVISVLTAGIMASTYRKLEDAGYKRRERHLQSINSTRKS